MLVAGLATGCGAGDSTVAKTPQPTAALSTAAPAAPHSPNGTSAPPVPSTSIAPPPDPCAVNLTAPTIAKTTSELPRDPRSGQPWNPEPLAGNYN
ncbi:MAG: LppP/LprE family lipoprotein, partial [Mycobacteriaceae bacterium]|nr:LppP/LprE family lipoprotein [Mycobacteriaceae bacterium]